MADPRIIDVTLDERTILWRSADIEQERRIAIFDLLEENLFAPQRPQPDGYAGPYKLHLTVQEGRLALEIRREDGAPLETLVLGLARFRLDVLGQLKTLSGFGCGKRDRLCHDSSVARKAGAINGGRLWITGITR